MRASYPAYPRSLLRFTPPALHQSNARDTRNHLTDVVSVKTNLELIEAQLDLQKVIQIIKMTANLQVALRTNLLQAFVGLRRSLINSGDFTHVEDQQKTIAVLKERFLQDSEPNSEPKNNLLDNLFCDDVSLTSRSRTKSLIEMMEEHPLNSLSFFGPC